MVKLTRDVTISECPWLDTDLPAGTEVEKFHGYTYGCIGSGIAVCFSQDGPFFEVPRAALADGRRKFQPVDAGKLLGDALHHAKRVVAAAVENDDQLERPGIIAPEKNRELAQHRFDARFFVVSRDEQQQAGVGHAFSFKFQVPG